MRTAAISILVGEIPKTLTKRYYLKDGELCKETVGQMAVGKCKVTSIANIFELSTILENLKHNQALCFGVPKGVDVGKTVEIVTREDKKPGQYSRTTDDFEWSKGAGVVFLDHDSGLSKKDFIEALNYCVPELQTVNKVWLPSSSSYIYNGNQELKGLGGQHLYFMVDDATKIPEIGATIHKRFWLNGMGHIQISAAGALLERSVVDASVWQCNRLDFASGAECKKPLEQKNRKPENIRGCRELLEVKNFKFLTKQEVFQYQQMVNEAKSELKAQAEKQQDKHIENRIKNAPKEKRNQLRKLYKQVYQGGVLAGDFEITLFKDNQRITKTVVEILADKKKYHKCKTLDPIEPEYNNEHKTGILYLDRKPVLNTKAHGERNYELKERVELTGGKATIAKMKEQLRQQKSGELYTVSLPWTRLSLSSQALYPGSVTIIAGPTKAGKSFFTQNIINYIHKNGESWAYLPLEDDKTAWLWRYMAIDQADFTMKHNDKETVEARKRAIEAKEFEYEQVADNLTENPRSETVVVNGRKTRKRVTPEFVLDWIGAQAKTKRVVVVDPIAQIDFAGRNRWEAEEAFMREAVGLVGDTCTSLILVAHTTKGSGGGTPISVENLQGSASFGRLSHTTIMVDCLDDTNVAVIGKEGKTEFVEANRAVMIAVARNGSGSRRRMAFNFDEDAPRFRELGFIKKVKK